MADIEQLILENLMLINQQITPKIPEDPNQDIKPYLISEISLELIKILELIKKNLDTKIRNSTSERNILDGINKEIYLLIESLDVNETFLKNKTKFILLLLEYQSRTIKEINIWDFLVHKFENEIDENKRIQTLNIVELQMWPIFQDTSIRDEFKIYVLSKDGRTDINFLFSSYNSYFHENAKSFSRCLSKIAQKILYSPKRNSIILQIQIKEIFKQILFFTTPSYIYIDFDNKVGNIGRILNYGKILSSTFENYLELLKILYEINKSITDLPFNAFLEFELWEILQINHLFSHENPKYIELLLHFLRELNKSKCLNERKLKVRNFLDNKDLNNRDYFITIDSLTISDAKNHVDNCGDLDSYSLDLLTKKNLPYILIKHKNIILGHIKLKGVKNFLSYVDIQNSKGEIILVKGLAYGIESKFEDLLIKRDINFYSSKIFVISLNKAKITPLRLVSSESRYAIDTFVSNIDDSSLVELEYTSSNWRSLFISLFKPKIEK